MDSDLHKNTTQSHNPDQGQAPSHVTKSRSYSRYLYQKMGTKYSTFMASLLARRTDK